MLNYMTDQKTLIILRHGHAENNSATGSDAARKLSPQGIAEAACIGKIINEKNLFPDLILCSAATRTRETLDGMQKLLPSNVAVEYSKDIYSASETELLTQIANIADKINSVMIIGHNPSLHQLAIRLAKRGDKKLRDDLLFSFPPCSIAVFSFAEGWKNIATQDSKITFFTTPMNECV